MFVVIAAGLVGGCGASDRSNDAEDAATARELCVQFGASRGYEATELSSSRVMTASEVTRAIDAGLLAGEGSAEWRTKTHEAPIANCQFLDLEKATVKSCEPPQASMIDPLKIFLVDADGHWSEANLPFEPQC